jgi:hypothetical protein
MILPHIIDWHMQVRGNDPDEAQFGDIDIAPIEPDDSREEAA